MKRRKKHRIERTNRKKSGRETMEANLNDLKRMADEQVINLEGYRKETAEIVREVLNQTDEETVDIWTVYGWIDARGLDEHRLADAKKMMRVMFNRLNESKIIKLQRAKIRMTERKPLKDCFIYPKQINKIDEEYVPTYTTSEFRKRPRSRAKWETLKKWEIENQKANGHIGNRVWADDEDHSVGFFELDETGNIEAWYPYPERTLQEEREEEKRRKKEDGCL